MNVSRRKILSLVGTSATALGSGCTTLFRSPSENNDETSSSTARQNTTNQSHTRSNDSEQLAYPHDIRRLARTSGKPLSAVSGLRSWTATGGSVTTTDWHGVDGNTGVRLVSPKKSTKTTMQTIFEKPLDLTSSALSLGVRLDRPVEDTVEIRLDAPDEHNQLMMERFIRQKMGTIRLDIAPDKTIGTPDPTNVRGLTVLVYTKTNEPLTLRVGAPRLRTSSRNRGAVILTFDDATHTQFDVAKPIMDEFGYTGTVGVIPWWIGRKGEITRKQLHTMAADGWEMASHPQRRNTPLPELSKAHQRKLIERSKRWLLDEGFDTGAQTLIWPFGRFDKRTLDFVGRYHRLAFGGGASPVPKAITESGWIPRIHGDNQKKVRRAVDMAAQFNTVMTVMYHTIGQSRISTAAFRNELRYIKQADVDVIMPSELANAQPY